MRRGPLAIVVHTAVIIHGEMICARARRMVMGRDPTRRQVWPISDPRLVVH
jgi:hypothetical protein